MQLPDQYAAEEQRLSDDARLATAVRVPMPHSERLRFEILGDLDADTRGVGWWQSHLDTQRRILVSDHLYACAASVIQNVTEAALHLGEYEAWRAQFDSLHSNLISQRPQLLLPYSMPPLRLRYPDKTPRADLIRSSCALHCAGLFRAIASAIDCMAAVIIGVEALPTPIFRADLGKLRRFLDKTAGDGDRRHRLLRDTIDEFVASSGPSGWLEWAIEMRNMLVHRGRRMLFATFAPRPTGIFTAVRTEFLKTAVQQFLPASPECSEIQAMIAGGLLDLLAPGEAIANCRGALTSAHALIEKCAASLVESWVARRKDPALLRQPEAQWKTVRPDRRTTFAGYSTERFRADELNSGLEAKRRFRAAGVLDSDRASVWGSVSSGP